VRIVTEQETRYFAKTVCDKLDVKGATLRKWCEALEQEAGYKFERDNRNHRLYSKEDLALLTQLKDEVSKSRNMTNAINTVMTRLEDQNNAKVLLGEIGGFDANQALKLDNAADLNVLLYKVATVASQKTAQDIMQQVEQAATAQLSSPEKEAKERQERKKESIWSVVEVSNLERKVDAELRKEARQKWEEKSLGEKGFFSRRQRRDDFIKDYIEDSREERIRERLEQKYN